MWIQDVPSKQHVSFFLHLFERFTTDDFFNFLILPFFYFNRACVEFRARAGRSTEEVKVELEKIDFELKQRLRRLGASSPTSSSAVSYEVVPGDDDSAAATDPADKNTKGNGNGNGNANNNDDVAGTGGTTPADASKPTESGSTTFNGHVIDGGYVAGIAVLGVLVVGLSAGVYFMTHRHKEHKAEIKRLSVHVKRLSTAGPMTSLAQIADEDGNDRQQSRRSLTKIAPPPPAPVFRQQSRLAQKTNAGWQNHHCHII